MTKTTVLTNKKSSVGIKATGYTSEIHTYSAQQGVAMTNSAAGVYATAVHSSVPGQYVSTTSSKTESYKSLNSTLNGYNSGY